MVSYLAYLNLLVIACLLDYASCFIVLYSLWIPLDERLACC